MPDKIMTGFLQAQLAAGLALARSSDIVRLRTEPGPLPQRYIAEFRCKTLLAGPTGSVAPGTGCEVLIWFQDDYLRRAEVPEVVSLIRPVNLYHPNVRFPFICVGRLKPGTPLVDLLYQIFEIVTYQKITMNERNALNFAACQWARANLSRLPLERRPLKRRAVNLEVSAVSAS
jgi:hypothetical protein